MSTYSTWRNINLTAVIVSLTILTFDAFNNEAFSENEKYLDVKVFSVENAYLSNLGDKLIINAEGKTTTSGWSDGRLVPPSGLTKEPPDGIIDLDFIAKAPSSLSSNVISDLSGIGAISQPKWLKGVRIHASTNNIEVLLTDKSKYKKNTVQGCCTPIPWDIDIPTPKKVNDIPIPWKVKK